MRVRAALSGKRILITGASGFLGKVWLCHLLREIPDLERVWVVLRPGGHADAHARLADLLAGCPAFAPLTQADLRGQLAAVDGDVTLPLCGISPAQARAMNPDLVVHLAGLTTLEPELDAALAANVDGALHALELARLTGARLLHVSTAYVAGRRNGVVPEDPERNAVPTGDGFSARQELADLRALAQRVRGEAHDQQRSAELRERARAQQRRLGGELDAFLATERDAWIKAQLAERTAARARRWGWPNLYALTKSLAESLLLEARGEVPVWIARPTVVESALAFPFPGWKEGLQTSAPLTYALTHGPLRGLPAKERLALDVIPVDFVARGLTLLSSALLQPEADPERVFHLGSSDANPFPMWRVIDLTALAHRKHEGLGHGKPQWRELLPEAGATSRAGYSRTSLPVLRRLTRGAGELLSAASGSLPDGLASKARKLARRAERAGKRLETLEEVVERFEPFVLTNDCVFAAQGLRELEAGLDDAERAAFAADPAQLDWRAYWIDVHIRGLRQWIYPRIEGRRLPPTERRELTLERVPLPAELEVQ